MVDLSTEVSVTDSISIEMEYGIVVCDTIEVTDKITILSLPTVHWLDVPYFLIEGVSTKITSRSRGPPN